MSQNAHVISFHHSIWQFSLLTFISQDILTLSFLLVPNGQPLFPASPPCSASWRPPPTSCGFLGQSISSWWGSNEDTWVWPSACLRPAPESSGSPQGGRLKPTHWPSLNTGQEVRWRRLKFTEQWTHPARLCWRTDWWCLRSGSCWSRCTGCSASSWWSWSPVSAECRWIRLRHFKLTLHGEFQTHVHTEKQMTCTVIEDFPSCWLKSSIGMNSHVSFCPLLIQLLSR